MKRRFLLPEQTLLVIIGPSGSGKSSAVQQLVKDGLLEVTPSWTTRSPRPGELENGLEHRFVTDQELRRKQAENYFLDVVQMFGLPYKYALPIIEHTNPGAAPTIMLRANLMEMLPRYYPNFVTYQIEDTLPRVKERLLERRLHGEELGSRLEDYGKEVRAGRTLADRIFVNDSDIKTVTQQLKDAVVKDFHL